MSIIEKMLRWVVLGGVFALPFIVFIISQTLFFPYITGKNFAFRIIVECITGAWLALALVSTQYRPKRSWLLGVFALFVLIIAIADAQGVYPFKSFWSNYERMDGWVTLAHLFAYFVVASSVLNATLWRRLMSVSLVASVLMGVYGLLQIAGITSLAPGYSSATRIDATFGNPIYLAVYMLFHVFIAALLLAKSREDHPSSRHSSLVGWYGGVIAFDTLILFLTGTRGAMLGLFGGTLVAFFLYAISSGSGKSWRKAGVVLLLFALFGGVLWTARDTALVRNINFLNRLSTISLNDPTTKARFLNWGMAMKGFQERPLLGWGQENYAIVFDKYYDSRMYSQEQWFDRVHNVIFDWLVAGGLLGLAGYLGLYIAALLLLWRGKAFSRSERSVLTGLLAAYLFHDMFVFDNISSYILFATVLAYIAWRAGEHEQRHVFSARLFSEGALPVVAVCAVLGVWGSAWLVNATPLAQNRALLLAMSPQQSLSANLDYFKQAISYQSYGTQEVREQLAQGAARLATQTSIPEDIRRSFVETATNEMEAMSKASPLDPRFPLFEGVVYDAAGMYKEGLQALERAHSLSPTKQSILYEIASNKTAQGDVSGALDAFKQAFELEESNLDARLYYAALAIRAGTDGLADSLLAPVIPSGAAADNRIVSAYLARGAIRKAVPIWEAKIKAQPEDYQAYFTLAALYYESKDSNRAVQTLQLVKQKNPEAAAQVDSLVAQIQSGTLKLQ